VPQQVSRSTDAQARPCVTCLAEGRRFAVMGVCVGRWCETKSKAMTCCGCGCPPWQHLFDCRGKACCCSLHQHSSHCLTPNSNQQTHSPNHFVAPCFCCCQFLHPGICVHALTHLPKQVRQKRLKDTKIQDCKDAYENHPGLFILSSDLDAMAALLDKERKQVRAWASSKLKS
jgi:hypothetical protein